MSFINKENNTKNTRSLTPNDSFISYYKSNNSNIFNVKDRSNKDNKAKNMIANNYENFIIASERNRSHNNLSKLDGKNNNNNNKNNFKNIKNIKKVNIPISKDNNSAFKYKMKDLYGETATKEYLNIVSDAIKNKTSSIGFLTQMRRKPLPDDNIKNELNYNLRNKLISELSQERQNYKLKYGYLSKDKSFDYEVENTKNNLSTHKINKDKFNNSKIFSSEQGVVNPKHERKMANKVNDSKNSVVLKEFNMNNIKSNSSSRINQERNNNIRNNNNNIFVVNLNEVENKDIRNNKVKKFKFNHTKVVVPHSYIDLNGNNNKENNNLKEDNKGNSSNSINLTINNNNNYIESSNSHKKILSRITMKIAIINIKTFQEIFILIIQRLKAIK